MRRIGDRRGIHPNSLKNLKPFKPGNKPAPRHPTFKERIRELTNGGAEIIEATLKIVRGEIPAPAAVRLQALQWLGDHYEGKPLERVASAQVTASADLAQLGVPTESLADLARLLGPPEAPPLVDGHVIGHIPETVDAIPSEPGPDSSE